MNNQVKKHIEEINRAIEKLNFGDTPSNLYDPITYIMGLGGKRIRPLFTLLAYQLYRSDYQSILRPALSIEVFHNFTLLHDDIMDRAPIRRGKPTVHKKWNDNVAILSGDVMLVRVYNLLLEAAPKSYKTIISAFNDCAAEVCEGQQYDMDYENREMVSEEEYLNMIKLKTAVLIGFSLELGARLAGAPESDVRLLNSFGVNIGIAFQLMDDLLDVFANDTKFGKKVGGDIIANKKTYLLIKALELAEMNKRQELEKWLSLSEFNESEKVKAVKKIFENLKIKEITGSKMNEFYDKGLADLGIVNVPEASKSQLIDLVKFLMNRES